MPDLPAPVVEAISSATLRSLRAFLNCEENSALYLFWNLTIPGEFLENGDGSVIDAIERRIAYLEREDAAMEVCFRRAEERRQRGK